MANGIGLDVGPTPNLRMWEGRGGGGEQVGDGVANRDTNNIIDPISGPHTVVRTKQTTHAVFFSNCCAGVYSSPRPADAHPHLSNSTLADFMTVFVRDPRSN